MSSPCYGIRVSPENADQLKRAMTSPIRPGALKLRASFFPAGQLPSELSPPGHQAGTARPTGKRATANPRAKATPAFPAFRPSKRSVLVVSSLT